MSSTSIFATWFTGNPALLYALSIGLCAYLLGRNAFKWFLFAYILPVIAPIALLLRHKNYPKPSPQWFLDKIQTLWVRRWAKKLDPGDFKNPPDGPKEP